MSGRKSVLTGKKRLTYSSEFKREAVRMMNELGMGAAKVSRDLGISQNSLGKWRRELEAQGQQAFPGHGNATEEELVRLRREVEVLRREREILKKAVSIFSQPPS